MLFSGPLTIRCSSASLRLIRHCFTASDELKIAHGTPSKLSQMEGAVHLSYPDGCIQANTAQDAAGLHCCKSKLLILVNDFFFSLSIKYLSVAKVLVLDLLTVWFGWHTPVYQTSWICQWGGWWAVLVNKTGAFKAFLFPQDALV